MKKKVLGLVVAALSISTFGAFAQTENVKVPVEQTADACCKDKQKDKKKNKGDKHKGHKMEGKKGRMNPFAGIDLTAEQQQKLDQLRADRKNRMEADKDKNKEARKQEREKFNAEVEKILTPQQYALYKSNCDSIKAKQKLKVDKRKVKDGKPGKKELKDKTVN